MHEDKVTVVGMVVGWSGWFFSHLAQINQLVQFFLLSASLILTLLAIWHKVRKMQ